MTTENDQIWIRLAQCLHASARRAVLPADAEQLLQSLPPDELSQAEEDEIVAGVMAGVESRQLRSRSLAVGDASELCDGQESIEEEVLQLNRNKGHDVEDEAAERLADELRRNALDEDNDSEEGEGKREP